MGPGREPGYLWELSCSQLVQSLLKGTLFSPETSVGPQCSISGPVKPSRDAPIGSRTFRLPCCLRSAGLAGACLIFHCNQNGFSLPAEVSVLGVFTKLWSQC